MKLAGCIVTQYVPPYDRLPNILPYILRYGRNTRVQFADKEDGLVPLFTSMRRPMHGPSCPKSQLKSTCLTAKFGSFLDHTEMGKGIKCDQFFCPTSDFYDFFK